MAKNAKKMDPPTEIRVSDLQVASYLLSLDYSVIRVEGHSPRTEFIFNVPENVIQQYYGGICPHCGISPRKLYGALRDLKGLLIHQDRGRR